LNSTQNDKSNRSYLRDSWFTDISENGARFIQPFDISENSCNEKNSILSNLYFALETKHDAGFGIAVQTSETIALRCPHCKDAASIMTPKMWFKKAVPYFDGSLSLDANNLQFQRVVGDMHNLEEHNRVVISLDHTLIIKEFSPNDVASYVCVDSETFNEMKKAFVNIRDRNQKINLLLKLSKSGLGNAQFEERFNHLFMTKKRNEIEINNAVLEFLFSIKYHLFLTELRNERQRDIFNPTTSITTFKDEKSSLHFYTSWSEWGECNICEEKPEQKRFGDCYIKYMPNGLGEENAELKDIEKMFFPFGWPCRFKIHLQYISAKSVKSLFQDYVEYRSCGIFNKTFCEEREKKTDEISVSFLNSI
jgi:hypothetical protein